ncbi:MAG TPA: dihydroorotate dehydrogenase-like protein [Tepidisphaeraceae bacterium]|nr:dihydroorotate dehydrogenase-like protein [Tepidisphaeraceae bacterium]
MSLATKYLGLNLAHPFMPGASPLVDSLDTVRRLEDAGASAIVMHSLFEEQISREQHATIYHMEMYAGAFAEVSSYFPKPSEFALGPDAYLKHIAKIKQAVGVPVIASLNGTTRGGWTRYAELLHQAGADALELNLYYLPTDASETGGTVERRVVDVLSSVRSVVGIPVAVKLSPFYSALPDLVAQLDDAGADGLVLFNRFYQPDIDLENLEVVPKVELSTSQELLLRLRWLSILSPHTDMSFACSGGVHTPEDAIKALMCGAHAVQLVSCLLKHGVGYLKAVRQGVQDWMDRHEYASLTELHGSMNLSRCPDPTAFERANYMRTLQSWPPRDMLAAAGTDVAK